MTDDSRIPRDPALPLMAMDILASVLERADDPARISAYLPEQISELTGARCVLLTECVGAAAGQEDRLLGLNPPRRRAWVDSPATRPLFAALRDLSATRVWRAADGSDPAQLLHQEGFDLSVAFPLHVGAVRAGALLVLGLPDARYLSSQVSLLETLSGVVALVLRNAALFQRQEEVIRERTRTLELANAALQGRETEARALLQAAEQARATLLDTIEDQRAAEAALRESERRMRMATEATGVGIWELNLATGRVRWDAQMFRIYGLEPTPDGYISHQDWRQTVLPEDLPQLEADLRHAVQERSQTAREFRIRRRSDGQVRFIYAAETVRVDAHGRTEWVVGTDLDITERKRGDEALRRELEINKAMAELARRLALESAGVKDFGDVTLHYARLLTGSEHGFVSFIDPRTGEHLSYTLTAMPERERLIAGENRRIVFPVGADGRHPKLWGHVLNTRQAFYTNAPATHPAAGTTPEGTVPLRNFLAVPALIGDRLVGEVVVANAARDYTDDDLELITRLGTLYAIAVSRAEAQQLVRTSEERLRLTLEATQIGVWDWDVTQDLYSASATYYTMLGYEPQPGFLDRQVWLQRVHPDDRARVRSNIESVVARHFTAYEYEARMRHADGGYRWVHVIGMATDRDPDGKIARMLGIRMDITERKRAEEALQKLNQELDQRVKERTADLNQKTAALEVTNRRLETVNKELEAFAYSVSHDLRAPLRAIDGFSRALLRDYGSRLDGEGTEYIQRIRSGAQRMAQLIDDILALSRLTRGEMQIEAIDLSAIATEIAAELAHRESGRKATFTIAPDLRASGDPRFIRLALENLLGNAWKFTSQQPETRIEFGAMERDGKTVFFVRDNGAGFDPQYAARLFRPFQRLHRPEEFPGTGIGLATVQRIVERHGGQVWAESAVNRGATFLFTL